MTALPEHTRVAIVGAGFAGIGMAAMLERAGRRDYVILERAGALGGVWRDNTYPGCQCDVPSHLYSFSFAPRPEWTRSFSFQPEIWQYLEDVADRFGIRSHIRFDAEVRDARWDEGANVWRIETAAGAITADALVFGAGALSEPSLPKVPGLDRFEGTVFHSASWRHDHELAGERVAVIGTGASAIQFVPRIQPVVSKLHVFQRTPPWIMPRADRPVGERERAFYRSAPFAQRLTRAAIYWGRELFALGFAGWKPMMRVAQFMAMRHLRGQVAAPALRAKVTPSYAIGCKRILPSNEWYPALQQPNVELVTDPIAEVRPHSIVTADGTERPVDTIIFGTGFNVTAHPAFDFVRGRGGRVLGDLWRHDGISAYKGTTVAGFPNLFLMTGPNTGLGHSSMIHMMESQFTYVLGALDAIDAHGGGSAEPKAEVQAAYNDGLQQRLARTVWNTGGCVSWYLDAHGRNRTLWPGFTWKYRLATRRFDSDAYRFASPGAHGDAAHRERPQDAHTESVSAR